MAEWCERHRLSRNRDRDDADHVHVVTSVPSPAGPAKLLKGEVRAAPALEEFRHLEGRDVAAMNGGHGLMVDTGFLRRHGGSGIGRIDQALHPGMQGDAVTIHSRAFIPLRLKGRRRAPPFCNGGHAARAVFSPTGFQFFRVSIDTVGFPLKPRGREREGRRRGAKR